MNKHKIRNVRTILTEPDGIRLVIVKVETEEPELYGIGCATFTPVSYTHLTLPTKA